MKHENGGVRSTLEPERSGGSQPKAARRANEVRQCGDLSPLSAMEACRRHYAASRHRLFSPQPMALPSPARPRADKSAPPQSGDKSPHSKALRARHTKPIRRAVHRGTLAQGWTLLEVLVSTCLLAGMILLLMQGFAMPQRTLSTTLRHAAAAVPREDAVQALGSVAASIVLDPRPAFAADGTTPALTSDGHFVCGPAKDLIPGEADAVGDAMFYQTRNPEGQMTCGGLFVRLASDEDTRPRLLTSLSAPRRRFCLIRWQQPATDNILYQPDATGRPALQSLTDRDALYRWFRDGIRHADQCHVVAEHVLLLSLLPEPYQSCYDTRRFQWEGMTSAALASKDQLPVRITLKILTVSEAAWQQALDQGSQGLESGWMQLTRRTQDQTQLAAATLTGLKLHLERIELPVRLRASP